MMLNILIDQNSEIKMNQEKLLRAAAFTPKALEEPNAWVGHLPFAAWLIQETAPKIFVELGTHTGNSYFSFCQSAKENGLSTKCYAVDTWQGDEHAGYYGDAVFHKVNAHNQAHYADFSRLLRMTFDDAVHYFADGSIELLHIDGLHTYEAVKHDFETWLPKLAPAAVVLFHDTNVKERGFGVWKLWEELQAIYPNNMEFINSHGLGVLQLKDVVELNELKWLVPNASEKKILRDYFAELGARQSERYELKLHLKPHIANLDIALTQTQRELAQTQGALDQAQNNLHLIVHSRSWRITKPLRIGRHFFSDPARILWRQLPLSQAAKRRIKSFLFVNFSFLFKKTAAYRAWLLEVRPFGDCQSQAEAYQRWIQFVEPPFMPSRKEVNDVVMTMESKPLISIITPVYNTPEKYLRLCIDSVLAQSYPYWELCIADDKSTEPHVRKVLTEYQKRDPRIKVMFREQNGHISRASNSALELATGDYVALLDHDDVLPEHALYFMAHAIAEHPEAQIFYSDEDKIDINGKRSEPHFKSDWNPDLFYSQNYVSHLGVYKRELLNTIGGFRPGVEGSQDQDLLLRCLPHVKAEQIIHIPKILYHWRTLEGSTAMASGEKSYTTDAGIKALSEYFAQHGPAGIKVEAGLVPNTYRVRWPIPDPAPLVSLLIPARDRKTITEVAVRSILDKTTYSNYEIIILDNGSVEPETLDWFTAIQQEDVRVQVLRYDHPFNYSAINNFGVKHANGSLIGLINNDVEVISPNWLAEMVSHALREDIGCVGAKLYYSNHTLQHAGVILGIGGVGGHSHKYFPNEAHGYFSRLKLVQNLSAVTAACLVVRKDVFEQVGGLDEVNLKVAFNDVDFCLKVREAGYCNLWTPYAELYHHESISRGHEDTPAKLTRFQREMAFMRNKWVDSLKSDPFYNPNLTTNREDFSLDCVPIK